MGRVFIKKIIFGTLIVVAFSIIYHNFQQSPEAQDVLKNTDDWSKPIDVVFVENISGEWVTFFRDNEQMYVGLLKQNWIGQWSLEDNFGNEGAVGNVAFDPNLENRTGIVWGVSGVSKGGDSLQRYYYGMISNREIDKITLSVDNGRPNNVSLIKSKGERFFFIRKEDTDGVPYEFQAISDEQVVARES